MSAEFIPMLVIGLVLGALLGFVFALRQQDRRVVQASARITSLEGDLQRRESGVAQSRQEVEDLKREVSRLSRLAADAGVDQGALSAARQPPKGQGQGQDKKRKESLKQENRRIRELEEQVTSARNQLENERRRLRERDTDMENLQEELEDLRRELDNQKAPQVASEPVAPEPRVPVPPVATSPVTPPPAANPEALQALEAQVETLRSQLISAEARRLEAAGVANTLGHANRQIEQRLQDQRARLHEFKDRMLKSEQASRKLQRQMDSFDRMYLGLKGRFDVARDTLATFQSRFGVALPTELGVMPGSELEDHLEFDDEELPGRPRGRTSEPPPGREGREPGKPREPRTQARKAERAPEERQDPGTLDPGAPEMVAPDKGAPDRGAPDKGAPDRGAPDKGVPDKGRPERGGRSGQQRKRAPRVDAGVEGTLPTGESAPADAAVVPASQADPALAEAPAVAFAELAAPDVALGDTPSEAAATSNAGSATDSPIEDDAAWKSPSELAREVAASGALAQVAVGGGTPERSSDVSDALEEALADALQSDETVRLKAEADGADS